jgi:hypothetical protein
LLDRFLRAVLVVSQAMRVVENAAAARRGMVMSTLRLALLVVLFAHSAAAAPPPALSDIQPQPIARAVHHPGPLVLRNEGTGEISKSFGAPIWAASVAAPDKSFSDLSILLLDGGSFLTPEIKQRFEQAIAAQSHYVAGIRTDIVGRMARASDAQDRAQAERELTALDRLRAHSKLIRPVRMADGRRGYSAVLGFSRIDTTFATVLPSPDGRYEVLVSIATPFEGGPAPNPHAARYQRALRDRPLDAVEAMALTVYQQLFPHSGPPRP